MRSIFITGAAAGIGRAIAQKFHAKGWFVGLFDIDEAGVKTLAEELGERSLAGSLDVSDIDAWNKQLEAFFSAAGQRLDVLVNNAGILASGNFESIPLQRHQAIININVNGVMNGCYAAFPWLLKTSGSCVVNMASASSIYGSPSLASYSASKFAVRGLTEALNLEWEPHGVRVCDVWPLFVQTQMIDNMKSGSLDNMGAKLSPEDVAATVEKVVHAGPKNYQAHWPAGFVERIFKLGVELLPARLCRALVKRVS